MEAPSGRLPRWDQGTGRPRQEAGASGTSHEMRSRHAPHGLLGRRPQSRARTSAVVCSESGRGEAISTTAGRTGHARYSFLIRALASHSCSGGLSPHNASYEAVVRRYEPIDVSGAQLQPLVRQTWRLRADDYPDDRNLTLSENSSTDVNPLRFHVAVLLKPR